MKPRLKALVRFVLPAGFAAFVGVSFLTGFDVGRAMGRTFAETLLEMLKLLPCAFVLIALFDVWVKRETVEGHFGRGAGIQGYLWGLVLAGLSVGGMYVAFPVAYALFRKGARLSVIFAYVGFAGVCRIPMTTFEASFLGAQFTAVRLAVSVPLVLLCAVAMGRVLEKRGYRLTE